MRALAPTRTVAPATGLLTTAEARAHVRVTNSDHDTYLDSLVSAAEAYMDGYSGVLGRALITQTWQQKFNDFPQGGELRLPLGDLQSVTSVVYYDTANASQTFTDFTAVNDERGPRLVLDSDASWPGTYERPDAVTVTWVCGYGAAADVPVAIIHAAKLLVGQWFDAREASGDTSTESPFAVAALLAPFRRLGV